MSTLLLDGTFATLATATAAAANANPDVSASPASFGSTSMTNNNNVVGSSVNNNPNSSVVVGTQPLIIDGQPDDFSETLREIGDLCVWSLSSAKAGFGIDQLRDDKYDTYWQSDGPQPHAINMQFQRKLEVSQIALYMSFKQDESYTPQKFAIRVGTTQADLREILTFSIDEPEGWKIIPLPAVKTRFIQVAIIGNHQNGRDTHLRQLKVFGPRPSLIPGQMFPAFQTQKFKKYPIFR